MLLLLLLLLQSGQHPPSVGLRIRLHRTNQRGWQLLLLLLLLLLGLARGRHSGGEDTSTHPTHQEQQHLVGQRGTQLKLQPIKQQATARR